jgi:hypothetical protein
MIRTLLIVYGIFATYVYGYGSFVATRYNESLFSGPQEWIIVDIVTLIVFWVWGDYDMSPNMNARPGAYIMLLLFVTFLGLLNFVLPSVPWYFDFATWNFAIAIGAAYFVLDELGFI